MKTVFFEKIYGVNITNFKTTEDVNKFIESRGKKPRIVELESSIANERGNIFNIRHFNVDDLVDAALKE